MESKSLKVQSTCPTVAEWFYSEYCNYKGREISKLSELTINSVFVNRIEPFIGSKRLNETTSLDCQDIILKQKEKNICHGTIFGTYSVLTRIFRSALSNDFITKENYPCIGLRSLTFYA